MPLYSVLLSIHGRIDRGTFWLKGVVPCLLAYCLVLPLYVVIALLEEADSTPAALVGLLFVTPLALGLIVLMLWSPIAICVKRLRDIGHSPWWVLVLLFFWPLLPVFILYLGIRKGKSEPISEGRVLGYSDADA